MSGLLIRFLEIGNNTKSAKGGKGFTVTGAYI